jgi:hypothetical protein
MGKAPAAWQAVAVEAKGFMPADEGMALYTAGLEVGQSGLGPFLEIGTYCGKSAVYLGAAAAEAGTVLFSVDHHRGSEELQPGWPHHDPEVVDPVTGAIDTLPWARRTLKDAGLEAHVALVVARSTTLATWWSTPLSLLFIDGGHGAEVAAADFASWVPFVAEGGLLAVHDVFADPHEGGQVPYELYCGVRASGEFEEAGGLGSLRLLRRRSPPPLPRSSSPGPAAGGCPDHAGDGSV